MKSTAVLLRPYRPGDAPALFEVYHSAIHLVASRDSSQERSAPCS